MFTKGGPPSSWPSLLLLLCLATSGFFFNSQGLLYEQKLLHFLAVQSVLFKMNPPLLPLFARRGRVNLKNSSPMLFLPFFSHLASTNSALKNMCSCARIVKVLPYSRDQYRSGSNGIILHVAIFFPTFLVSRRDGAKKITCLLEMSGDFFG